MRRRHVALVAMLVFSGACGGSDSGPSGGFAVGGHVHAGPTCPVVQDPPDPGCDDRPVGDALLLVEDAEGRVVAQVRSGEDGRFSLVLPEGDYTLVPQPVEGLLGTAAEQDFTVDGPVDDLDVAYDTGIR